MRASPLIAFFALGACSITGCFHDFDEPFSGSGASGGGGSGASSSGGEDPSGGGGSTSNGGAPQGGRDEGGGGGSTTSSMDCTGAEVCAPSIPEGWQGPVRFFAGATERPECGAAPLADAFTGTLDAPDATCIPCFCGAGQGATCGPATIDFYDFADICTAGGTIITTVTATALCQSLPVFGDLNDGTATAKMQPGAVASPGSCMASGGGVSSLPPTSWSDNARICSPDPAGSPCGNGGTCVAPAAGPFQGGPCVTTNGDAECPSGYAQRYVVYEDTADGRGCAACACNAPTGASCSFSARVWGSTDCAGGGSFPLDDDGVCEEHFQNALSYRLTQTNIQQGSCTPMAGGPTGEVTGTEPWTVCCL